MYSVTRLFFKKLHLAPSEQAKTVSRNVLFSRNIRKKRTIFELCDRISSLKRKISRNRVCLSLWGPGRIFKKKNDRKSRDTVPLKTQVVWFVNKEPRISQILNVLNGKKPRNCQCFKWQKIHSLHAHEVIKYATVFSSQSTLMVKNEIQFYFVYHVFIKLNCLKILHYTVQQIP